MTPPNSRSSAKLAISHTSLVNALGYGCDASLQALQQGKKGLRRCDFEDVDLPTWVGRVDGLETAPVEGKLAHYDCRNNRLAQAGLQTDDFAAAVSRARQQYGANRVGVFLGTSTSGIRQTELAYAASQSGPEPAPLPADFYYQTTHNTFSVADYCQRALELTGPVSVVSTACSSSAKVFAVAYRHIAAGYCDAAVVGGVDSLCATTLYGFNSLELVSQQPCRPWDTQRDGINIGEAAGFALLEKPEAAPESIMLLGYGESSDAYHMSTPHPEGAGAKLAMQRALTHAEKNPEDINYLNLHGTATPSNDSAEDAAVVSLFGSTTPASSTKGWTGHTLGAAGITESVFCCLAIQHGFMPKSLNTVEQDPTTKSQILLENRSEKIHATMTNSFGFGGTNCSLVLGKVI